MSVPVYVVNASMAVLLLLLALFAGLSAGCLAFRRTTNSLKRTAVLTLAILGSMTLLAAAKLIMLIATYSYRSWFVLDNALLFFVLILLPTAAIAYYSLPRLIDLAKLMIKSPEETANRTKRRAASEVALVVPVQVLVIEAFLYASIQVFPLGMAYRKEMLAVGLAVLASPALLIWRQSIRHRRIHRDDGTAVSHKVKRVLVFTMACLLLAFGIIYTMNNAKTLSRAAERDLPVHVTMMNPPAKD
ncbi:hypothetical protein [Paenibacillus montanisoli]|uniref:Uncharacterized protein n=1 Tax=Paenibacillus montanisoli TaxID=2081970 RepID=A0A328U3E9_9BACL|nr:hypothetical protein [Paenibacillus montanisoli]RAP77338.1 hypothetical protein DL346_02260 [Paenibacillus montanisoli]